MKTILKTFTVIVLFVSVALAQGFNVKASGEQKFSFIDQYGRNQATFYSTTPLEDINGLTNDVKGTASFDVNDLTTLKGSFSVQVSSLKTGNEMRDGHLRGKNWLDAANYPEMTFTIKKVSDIKQVADNELEANILGDFTLRGVTKEITAEAKLVYLDENEQTRKKSPGDLIGVRAKLSITLSDFGVSNEVLGAKVSDKIEIGVNIFGTNAK